MACLYPTSGRLRKNPPRGGFFHFGGVPHPDRCHKPAIIPLSNALHLNSKRTRLNHGRQDHSHR